VSENDKGALVPAATECTEFEVIGIESAGGFALAQRVASAFAASSLVPEQFRGSVPNCLVAINMAARMHADPLMVMQNLYVVHGRPAWSAQFMIASFNQCGRFTSMRFEWRGEPGARGCACRAWAVERSTGDRIEGTWVTWDMVDREGWSKRNGSKWLTLPEQMFRYRAATFFVRAYAPEIALGIPAADEIEDAVDAEVVVRPARSSAEVVRAAATTLAAHADVPAEPEVVAESPAVEAEPAPPQIDAGDVPASPLAALSADEVRIELAEMAKDKAVAQAVRDACSAAGVKAPKMLTEAELRALHARCVEMTKGGES